MTIPFLGTMFPIMGMIIPNMGNTAGGIADALFDQVQKRVLVILFGEPDRSFSTTEIIRIAGSGVGAVHRTLVRLATAGLLTVQKLGNQKVYKANQESPVFQELHGLILKTAGLVSPIADALAPFGQKIHAAFVYGSVAKGRDHSRSDVDLIVIAEGLDYPTIFEALQPVERILGRSIHPRVLRPGEWKRKLSSGNSFIRRIWAGPKHFVVGSANAIA
ncbi:MAG: transcriptional regulator [Gemmatimonadota bacterium]|nr:transcriptional regulator [Gemmatimonadota bacterium]